MPSLSVVLIVDETFRKKDTNSKFVDLQTLLYE